MCAVGIIGANAHRCATSCHDSAKCVLQQDSQLLGIPRKTTVCIYHSGHLGYFVHLGDDFPRETWESRTDTLASSPARRPWRTV